MPRWQVPVAVSRASRLLPAPLVSLFLILLYSHTLSPGLTWRFDGADGGDLIAAAATGGVPHPTGYPTYLVLASAFLRIPAGSLAFRTNLLSLTSSVLAAWLIYKLVAAARGNAFAASAASLAFGTAPLIWSQSIITEVYALQALLTVGVLFLLLVRQPIWSAQLALGIAAGLSLGNHMMGALLLPLLLLKPDATGGAMPASAGPAKSQPVWLIKVYLQRVIGLLAGASVYLMTPLRASTHSPVNWGNVHSPRAFMWVVSGEMYWDRLHESSVANLVTGARSWAHMMTEQLTVPGLLLTLLGLIVLFRPRNLHIAIIWVTISSSLLAIFYYSPDSYVYLVPAIVSCSVGIGLGSCWLMEWASTRAAYGGAVASFAIVVVFLLRGVLAVPRMDLRGDRGAEDFGRAVLASAPHEAILLTEGDESTFALWYFHYALHQRPDVSVVSVDLLTQPWYHEVLGYTYADLVVPREPWPAALTLANPGRPVCAVSSILPARLDCSGD